MATVSISEAIHLYRDALISLIPVAEKADICWKGERVYDPWENIERVLYHSILGSCVENSPILPLAPYDLVQPNYAKCSFLVSADFKNVAFLKLRTITAPFDEAVFLELGSDLIPTGKRSHMPLAEVEWLIATPHGDRPPTFQNAVEYQP